MWYHVIIPAGIQSRGAVSWGFITGLYRCRPALKHSKAISSVSFSLGGTVQRLPVQNPHGSRCIPAPHNPGYSHSFLRRGSQAGLCLLSAVPLVWHRRVAERQRRQELGRAALASPAAPGSALGAREALTRI